MPTSATGNEWVRNVHVRPGGPGFTLIELVVALSIALLVMAAAPLAVARAYDSMQYRATVKHFIVGLKLARNEAMRSGHGTAFNVNIEARRFGIGQQLNDEIPEKLAVRMMVADKELSQQQGGVRFFPDGSSTGGAFEIVRSSGGGIRIEVDWLLGRLRQRALGT